MDDETSRELDEITFTTQADVGRFWALLMQPLGFGGRSLWVNLVGPDRRPTKMLTEIAQCDPHPDEPAMTNLFTMLSELIDDLGGEHSVALLMTRPGGERTTAQDREWARALIAGARRHDIPLEPLHLATDLDVLAVAPDDLAA